MMKMDQDHDCIRDNSLSVNLTWKDLGLCPSALEDRLTQDGTIYANYQLVKVMAGDDHPTILEHAHTTELLRLEMISIRALREKMAAWAKDEWERVPPPQKLIESEFHAELKE